MEVFCSSFYILKTRLKSKSLEPLIGFLTFLVQRLWPKKQKIVNFTLTLEPDSSLAQITSHWRVMELQTDTKLALNAWFQSTIFLYTSSKPVKMFLICHECVEVSQVSYFVLYVHLPCLVAEINKTVIILLFNVVRPSIEKKLLQRSVSAKKHSKIPELYASLKHLKRTAGLWVPSHDQICPFQKFLTCLVSRVSILILIISPSTFCSVVAPN